MSGDYLITFKIFAMAMFMYNLGSNIGTKMLIFRVIGKKNLPKQQKCFKKEKIAQNTTISSVDCFRVLCLHPISLINVNITCNNFV